MPKFTIANIKKINIERGSSFMDGTTGSVRRGDFAIAVPVFRGEGGHAFDEVTCHRCGLLKCREVCLESDLCILIGVQVWYIQVLS